MTKSGKQSRRSEESQKLLANVGENHENYWGVKGSGRLKVVFEEIEYVNQSKLLYRLMKTIVLQAT